MKTLGYGWAGTVPMGEGKAGDSRKSYPGVLNKATRIDLFSFGTPQMRAFHVTWFSFFLCIFEWFGIAPLMALSGPSLR